MPGQVSPFTRAQRIDTRTGLAWTGMELAATVAVAAAAAAAIEAAAAVVVEATAAPVEVPPSDCRSAACCDHHVFAPAAFVQPRLGAGGTQSQNANQQSPPAAITLSLRLLFTR